MNTAAAFWADLQAAWAFFLLLSKDAPLWVWTPLIGLLMALAVTEYLKRALDKISVVDLVLDAPLAKRRRDRREFAIETVAAVSGALSTWLLMRGLPGLLLGILVGLLAPNVWSGIAVLWRPVHAAWQRRWGAK